MVVFISINTNNCWMGTFLRSKIQWPLKPLSFLDRKKPDLLIILIGSSLVEGRSCQGERSDRLQIYRVYRNSVISFQPWVSCWFLYKKSSPKIKFSKEVKAHRKVPYVKSQRTKDTIQVIIFPEIIVWIISGNKVTESG